MILFCEFLSNINVLLAHFDFNNELQINENYSLNLIKNSLVLQVEETKFVLSFPLEFCAENNIIGKFENGVISVRLKIMKRECEIRANQIQNAFPNEELDLKNYKKFLCRKCGVELSTKNVQFDRVSALPSEIWTENSSFWFCHDHSSGANTPKDISDLIFESNNVILGKTFILVPISALMEGQKPLEGSKFESKSGENISDLIEHTESSILCCNNCSIDLGAVLFKNGREKVLLEKCRIHCGGSDNIFRHYTAEFELAKAIKDIVEKTGKRKIYIISNNEGETDSIKGEKEMVLQIKVVSMESMAVLKSIQKSPDNNYIEFQPYLKVFYKIYEENEITKNAIEPSLHFNQSRLKTITNWLKSNYPLWRSSKTPEKEYLGFLRFLQNK